MNKPSLIYVFALLFGVFISSLSQVVLKKAAMKDYSSHLKEYLNPQVIIAYTIFFSATLLSIFAYKGIPLSMGPVLESTSYLYVTFWGRTFFHEKITKRKILALLIIICGIVFFSVMN